MTLDSILKVAAFLFIIIIGFLSSWVAGWHLGPSMLSLLIILCGYTLLLVLPITKFKLSPSGFEGELERLAEQVIQISSQTENEVNSQLEEFSENTVEPDLLLMRLSIEIETTLREIAEKAGMIHTRVGIGMLIRFLEQKEIITERWLIEAISFFQKYRNALVHEGKTKDIENGIEIGRTVLGKLKEIH